ncbi:MAG TPA: hypothetical protein VJN18_32245 [Polyangiaceae bacterium]|nr:hypothetical protein [Polyangiaceae bacterium]
MTPEQQQRFQIYLDWFALGLARAVAIEHTLFWGRFKVQEGPHEPQDAFALFVVGTATANRAHELLLSLPLCTTDLGEVPPRRYGPDPFLDHTNNFDGVAEAEDELAVKFPPPEPARAASDRARALRIAIGELEACGRAPGHPDVRGEYIYAARILRVMLDTGGGQSQEQEP